MYLFTLSYTDDQNCTVRHTWPSVYLQNRSIPQVRLYAAILCFCKSARHYFQNIFAIFFHQPSRKAVKKMTRALVLDFWQLFQDLVLQMLIHWQDIGMHNSLICIIWIVYSDWRGSCQNKPDFLGKAVELCQNPYAMASIGSISRTKSFIRRNLTYYVRKLYVKNAHSINRDPRWTS